MLQDLMKKIISQPQEKYSPGDSIRNSSGVVCINCIGCSKEPNPCYDSCIRCMCSATQREGDSERVRLCGIKDIEVSGKAASYICRISSVMHVPSMQLLNQECKTCTCSPQAIMGHIWETFPESGFGTARNMLQANPGLNECQTCIKRTDYLISNSEYTMKKIADEIYCEGDFS